MVLITKLEYASFAFGLFMLLSVVPFVAIVVGGSVLWEACDRLFKGKPLTGYLVSFASWVVSKTSVLTSKLVKKAADGFIIDSIVAYGVGVPLLLLYNVYVFQQTGTINWSMVYVYHVLRIGPYFMNFAYVYTLCHKEGHTRIGFFKGQLNNSVLRYVFNWWIGLFYGVVPSSFAYGHTINHHRYNNGPADIISTSDKERDSVTHFVAYLPRFFLYAINVSTIQQFYRERNFKIVTKMSFGSLWYGIWVLGWTTYDPLFSAAYILYPLFENTVLLAAINWSWHAFLDPNDPEDEYVGSLTIFEGQVNVLNEDYHVVHHLYPGAHWTDHPRLYKKHEKEYVAKRATAFRDTHAMEVFFMVILRDYDMLASKFVDLQKPDSTKEEIIELLQSRVRTCWWGPRRNLTVKLQGREIGNLDDGKSVENIDPIYHKRVQDAAKKAQ